MSLKNKYWDRKTIVLRLLWGKIRLSKSIFWVKFDIEQRNSLYKGVV